MAKSERRRIELLDSTLFLYPLLARRSAQCPSPDERSATIRARLSVGDAIAALDMATMRKERRWRGGAMEGTAEVMAGRESAGPGVCVIRWRAQSGHALDVRWGDGDHSGLRVAGATRCDRCRQDLCSTRARVRLHLATRRRSHRRRPPRGGACRLSRSARRDGESVISAATRPSWPMPECGFRRRRYHPRGADEIAASTEAWRSPTTGSVRSGDAVVWRGRRLHAAIVLPFRQSAPRAGRSADVADLEDADRISPRRRRLRARRRPTDAKHGVGIACGGDGARSEVQRSAPSRSHLDTTWSSYEIHDLDVILAIGALTWGRSRRSG